MKPATLRNLRIGAFAALMTCTLVAHAADSEGWTLYKKFVAECETATSMEQLLPYLPEWRHGSYEDADQAGREEMLRRMCQETAVLADIAFVSEEESMGTDRVLHLKATWDGDPMVGRVTIVREGDAPKVEDWSWVTGD